MKEFMAKAKEKGWHPVIYGDGLSWVIWQKNTNYDGIPYFRTHDGEAAVARKWDGTYLVPASGFKPTGFEPVGFQHHFFFAMLRLKNQPRMKFEARKQQWMRLREPSAKRFCRLQP